MKKHFILFFISLAGFFFMLQAQPTLTIGAVSNISTFKAQLNANISSLGGWTVNGKGFMVSKTPTFDDFIRITSVSGTANTNTKTGDFYYYPGTSPTATSKPYFEPGTTYYVKAYAKKGSGSSADTVFTGVVSFTTLTADGGICQIDSLSHITYTSARIYGKISSVNDAWKIAKTGVVVGLEPNPTVDNATVYTSSTNTGTLPKTFNINADGLYQGATYYVRVWIANQYTNTYYDTTYSQQSVFTTLCAVDSVPENVTFDSVGINNVEISWTPRSGQYLFEVDYGFAGHEPGEGTILSCVGNHISIDGLEGGRSYSVFVRAACNGASGEWSVIRTFTTRPSLCANVNTIRTSNLTNSFAQIEWTPGSMSQTVWEVLFAKANESYPSTPFMVYNTPVFSPIGLNQNTQYKVKVRANCDPYYSDWTEDYMFTTLVMGTDDVEKSASKVLIYPNPSEGRIYFEQKNVNVNLMEIYNSQGIKIYSSDSVPEELDLSESGIYFIRINTDKGIQTEKIVVR